MSTPTDGRAKKRSTKILTRGIDPIVVKLRTEQVRQGMSDYRLAIELSKQTGSTVDPSTLGKLWKGKANPNLDRVREVLNALRVGNPEFILTDP